MDTSVLIDKVIANTDFTVAADADNTVRRAEILQHAQEEVELFWNLRGWPWSYTTADVTVAAAGNSIALPVDFQELGAEGGVYQATGISNPVRMTEVNPQQIHLLQKQSRTTNYHEVFAIQQVDDTIATQKLQVAPVSGSTDFSVYYKVIAPVLVDATGITSLLQRIPSGYHYSVILQAVSKRSAMSKGQDNLAMQFDSNYKRAMEPVLRIEQRRRSSKRRLGRAVPFMY